MATRRTPHRSQGNRYSSALAWPIVFVLGGVAGASYLSGGTPSLQAISAALPRSGCYIEGNVSIESGERIYHVPGQKYYHETIIRPEYGERWFCSEKAARQAGWRRSRV